MSFGQANFSEGYVVLANNDTVRGYIKDQFSYRGAKSISFKKENNDTKELSYSIEDILSFCLSQANEIYISEEVEIDKKPIETSRLENNWTRKIERERILLKVLVRGKADLYQYVDENYKEHFFFKKEGSITELAYIRFITKSGQLAELAEYKQQLQNLFSDCQKISKRNYVFSLSSFSKSFKDYNNCMQSLSFTEQKQKVKIIPSLQMGLALNQLNYEGADNINWFSGDYASGYNYNVAPNAIIGVSFDFKVQTKTNSITPTVELSWRKAGAFSASNNVEDPYSRRKDFNISVSFLSLNMGVKYSFAKNSFLKPFGKLGIGYRYLLYSDTNMVTTVFNKSTVTEPLVDLRKSGFGFVTSIGCSVKRVQFELSYDITRLFADSIQALLNIHSPTITIGYSLSR
jgi:hypothetical protein